MKSNQAVINDFLETKDSYNKNLKSEGLRLINYDTCIAQIYNNGTIALNDTKYSVSTTKIQSLLRQAVKDSNLFKRVIHINNVPIDTTYLDYFIK